MGILNVTPDSFSGDGVGSDLDAAVRQAIAFQRDGADIIDVGGESTRPPSVYSGTKPVTADEEAARVVPVIERLVSEVDVPISVDTSKAAVAKQAIAGGASIVNDVWAMQRDSEMASVVAKSGVPIVLMHNQQGAHYDEVVLDVIAALGDRIVEAKAAGIAATNLVVDPGIGFGKTAVQNLEIMRRLDEFKALRLPLLVGMSRKSTIGHVLDLPVEERVEGTAATVALSIVGGADIVRVHDVKEMARVARMTDAIVRGWDASGGH